MIGCAFGSKGQYAAESPTSPTLDSSRKIRIQKLNGAIHYYAPAVNNKLMVALSKLAQKQSSLTDDTNRDILQLLDYLTTYPNDGITYRAIDMILPGHGDAANLNVLQALSRA